MNFDLLIVIYLRGTEADRKVNIHTYTKREREKRRRERK